MLSSAMDARQDSRYATEVCSPAIESLRDVMEQGLSSLRDAHEFLDRIEDILDGSVPRANTLPAHDGKDKERWPIGRIAQETASGSNSLRNRLTNLRERLG